MTSVTGQNAFNLYSGMSVDRHCDDLPCHTDIKKVYCCVIEQPLQPDQILLCRWPNILRYNCPLLFHHSVSYFQEARHNLVNNDDVVGLFSSNN